jgi:hypothetical protein
MASSYAGATAVAAVIEGVALGMQAPCALIGWENCHQILSQGTSISKSKFCEIYKATIPSLTPVDALLCNRRVY